MALIESSVLNEKLSQIPSYLDEEHESFVSLRDLKKLVALMPTVEYTSAPDTVRVLSLEDLKRTRICWVEDVYDGMGAKLFPAVVYGVGKRANDEKAVIFLAHKPWSRGNTNYEWWYDLKDFLKWWRPWSQKPTEEQIEETEWK